LAINYSRQIYNYYWSSENGDEDFYAKATSVGIPLLLRYSWPSFKIRPFFNAGGLVIMNLRNQSILYRTTFSQNTINLEIDRTVYISDYYYGVIAGAGVEYRLKNRDYVSTEVRYSILWPSERPHLINMNVLNITMGYFF
jgi:outer membrane protein W